MEDTFGRAGLMANTTCLSVRAMGTVLLELTDSAIEMWLPVGDVGVHGIDSSTKKKKNKNNGHCSYRSVLHFLTNF